MAEEMVYGDLFPAYKDSIVEHIDDGSLAVVLDETFAELRALGILPISRVAETLDVSTREVVRATLERQVSVSSRRDNSPDQSA